MHQKPGTARWSRCLLGGRAANRCNRSLIEMRAPLRTAKTAFLGINSSSIPGKPRIWSCSARILPWYWFMLREDPDRICVQFTSIAFLGITIKGSLMSECHKLNYKKEAGIMRSRWRSDASLSERINRRSRPLLFLEDLNIVTSLVRDRIRDMLLAHVSLKRLHGSERHFIHIGSQILQSLS